VFWISMLLVVSHSKKLVKKTTDKPSTECEFSPDCKGKCEGIADADCLCNLGKCIGNPFTSWKAAKCSNIEDCACRMDPSNCACVDGFCKLERNECDISNDNMDCYDMDKCKKKKWRFLCACTGYTCEKNRCPPKHGYKCTIKDPKEGYYIYEKLPKQCDTIKDCIKKGKCKSSEPCWCIDNQCKDTKSRLVPELGKRNCKSPESRYKECQNTILDCAKNQCTCRNPKEIIHLASDGVIPYGKWGFCSKK